MTRHALVFGAGGAVGEAVARHLADRGWRVTGSMRTKRDGAVARLAAHGVSPAFHDLRKDDWRAAADGADALVFTLHLELALEALLRTDVDADRILAFSSNNVAVDANAPAYRKLAFAEDVMRKRHPQAMLVRPTLIYGDPRLPTLPRVIAMARTWPVLPLPGSGRARVQPVFYEDLGALAAGLVEEGAAGGVYAVGGPDVVTMRAFLRAACVAAGKPSKAIFGVPRAVLMMASPFISNWYSSAQAARADFDRLAVEQTPLPSALAPRTDVRAGLAQLVSALDGSPVRGG